MSVYIVEWTETVRRRCYVEAPSEEAIQAEWDEQYDSSFVDEIENAGTEVDGGIDWDTLDIDDSTRVTEPDVVIEP